MKIACVIPARLKSSRFPKKVLALLQGKPVIQWVWEAALRTKLFETVVFAIDAAETAACIDNFKGKYYLTDEGCLTGTDRLIELQQRRLIEADIWVNWQGDEPFLHKAMIQDLLQSCGKDGSDVWTLKKKITHSADVHSPHIPKVVTDEQGFALYFSRSPIPYYRDPLPESQKIYSKHIGIYAYAAAALKKIAALPPGKLEKAESLEQLRYLENGLKVRVHETQYEGFGIDLPEHLVKAEEYILKTSFASELS